ncbi:MAG: hypothetical protein ACM3OC_07170 [Deltaproteobacteria bacterium]
MRRSAGLTFVTIMIIIALAGLALRFSIEHLILWNIAQDEANAKDTLRLVSTALENYAEDHLGMYPGNLSALFESEPPYIDRAYTQMGTQKGYVFDCRITEANGYSCTASPSRCRLTGTAIYRVTTGGSITAEVCGPGE